jgi:hypothetical protein
VGVASSLLLDTICASLTRLVSLTLGYMHTHTRTRTHTHATILLINGTFV